MAVRVIRHGPLFTPAGRAALHEYTDELAGQVATGVEVILKKYYGQFFKNPTGFYESQTVVTNRGFATRSVNDSGVVYGPWLAGTGSRNATTSFKGYPHWTRGLVEGRQFVRPAADALWPKYAARLGGTP